MAHNVVSAATELPAIEFFCFIVQVLNVLNCVTLHIQWCIVAQAKRLFTECGCERLALHKRMWKALKSEAAWNAMHLAAQQWRPAAAS